ncbi:hypothetical protein SANA_06520 [Gottschalkiaceae bacterium SANA]|nr:hypothetical protein SANA_06520 [Gottschalkiaceae bacterium SANA]
MKRLLAFLLIAVLLAGAVGTSAFAAPGNSGKVHWKDQLIMKWDEMLEEYLALKDKLEDHGSLNGVDEDRYDELEEILTSNSKEAKKFYLALRNHLNNKHYVEQPYVQDAVSVMNRFRHRFENWDVLPFNSIISHKYNFLFDTPPMLADGRTLVPVRALVEALDADVDWIPYWDNNSLTFGNFAGFSNIDLEGMSETADEWLDDEMNANINVGTRVSVVRITLEDVEIALFIDFPVAYVKEDGNIRWEALDTKPQIFDDRTYVPLRFISETFDLEVTWDDGTIIIDDDDDQDEPNIPSDIARNSGDVTQEPITGNMYKLNVNFDPSDYDVTVTSTDGLDQGNNVDLLVNYNDFTLFNFKLDGYYVGLAIDVPDEIDYDYDTEDVVDVEWRGNDIDSYQIVNDELYVYVPVTKSLVGTSPNLEVRWDLDLDRETFDVKLQYLAFENAPVVEMPIDRVDDEVIQYNNVGGLNLDFNFDGDDKDLDIVGETGNQVPFIEAGDPLPTKAGNFIGIRIPSPDGFDDEDFEYIEFESMILDEDEFDLNDNRLVYYLEVDQENQAVAKELRIKWGPEYVDELIEIRWFGLNLEDEIVSPIRSAGSIQQDPAVTGGLGLEYVFDEMENELTITTQEGRAVTYYKASEGSLMDLDDVALVDGNWVGIEILLPTNYDGETIKELKIGGETWTDLDLDGSGKDRLWFYFEAEVGVSEFEIEIIWADNFEAETIEVIVSLGELAEPTE